MESNNGYFIPGTQVLTFNGYKNIEDVTTNDKVYTSEGTWENVTDIQERDYSGKLYRIKLHGQVKMITSTEEQSFFSKNYTKKSDSAESDWINVKGLSTKKYGLGIKFSKINRDLEFILNDSLIVVDQPQEWFMLGYFLGNGWVSLEEPGKIYLLIYESNGQRVKSVIESITELKQEGACLYTITDDNYYHVCHQFGKYSNNKRIPEWVQNAKPEHIQEFIKGYRRTDNYIRKGFWRNKYYGFITTSANIAYGLQRLYLKLGLVLKIKWKDDHYVVKRYFDKRHHRLIFLDDDNRAWFSVKSIKTTNTVDYKIYGINTNGKGYTINNSHVLDTIT